MLEFSWAVDDIELGITHVLRGKDLVIEDRMQRYIWDLLGIQGPPFLHWGILRVREAKVAKSKSFREVKSGLYDGWADPRTWSLRSLDRRGISMGALRAFILSFGMSLADIEVPAETLYAENRKRIDADHRATSLRARPRSSRGGGVPSRPCDGGASQSSGPARAGEARGARGTGIFPAVSRPRLPPRC